MSGDLALLSHCTALQVYSGRSISLSLGPEKLLDGVFSYSGAAGNSETLPQTGHSSMMMAMIKILIIY